MDDPRPSTSSDQTAVALRDVGELSSGSRFGNEELQQALALQATNGTTNVRLFANHSAVHIGTENKVQCNFFINVGGNGNEALEASNFKQLFDRLISATSAHRPSTPRSNVVLTDLSSRWYYWAAALVALSCVGSIVAAITFAINNLSLPTDQGVGDVDVLATLHRAFWFLVVPLVTLSCMNLVSTMLLSFSRVAVPKPKIFDNDLPEHPTTTNEDRDLVEDLPGGLKLMKRAFWRARFPRDAVDDNLLPVPVVVVCHTATRSPSDTDEIALIINGFQRYHMEERSLDDVSYNFLIGADGNVYEGRGWAKVPGHARGRGRGALAVAVIGNFVHELPPACQLDTLFRFLQCGVELGMLEEDYRLMAHCQVVNTASPGAALLDKMVTWPKFDHTKPLSCSSN